MDRSEFLFTLSKALEDRLLRLELNEKDTQAKLKTIAERLYLIDKFTNHTALRVSELESIT